MLITNCLSLVNNSSHVFVLHWWYTVRTRNMKPLTFLWTVRNVCVFFFGVNCAVSTIVNLWWLLFYANSLHFGVFVLFFQFLWLLFPFFGRVVFILQQTYRTRRNIWLRMQMVIWANENATQFITPIKQN